MADNDVRIKLGLEGDDRVRSGLKGVGDEADNSDGKLGRLAKGGLKGVAVGAAALFAGAAAAGAGLMTIASGAAAAGDRVDEMSQKLGISNQAYQEWDYILSQNGASIDSMKGSLTRLNNSVDDAKKGTGPAAEAFSKLGLSVDELSGMSREATFEATIKGLQGVEDPAARAALATDLLGRSAAELGPLLNAGAADTEALRAKAQELGLVMSDEAVAAADQYGDSMDTLKRTMEGVRNQIGAQLLPGFNMVIEGLTGLVSGQEGASEKIKEGMTNIIGTISGVLPQVMGVVGTVIESLAAAAPGLIGALITGITQAIPGLIGAVVPLLSGLVGTVVNLGPQLITAGVQAILALASGLQTTLPTLIPLLITGVMTMIGGLVSALPALLQAGIGLIMALANGLISALPTLIAQLPTIINAIVTFLVTGIPMLINAGVQLFMALITALPTIITQIVAVLPTLITAVINAILGAIPLLIDAGIKLLIALVENLPAIITAVVQAIPKIISAVLNAVMSNIPKIIAGGIQLFIALIGALPQIIGTIIGAIPQIIGGVVGAIMGSIPKLIQAGYQLLVSLVGRIGPAVSSIVAKIPQIITGIVNSIGKGLSDMMSAGRDLVEGLWQGIMNAKDWLLNMIGGWADSIIGGIKGFFGIASPSKVMAEIGKFLGQGFAKGLRGSESEVKAATDSMVKKIKEAMAADKISDRTGNALIKQVQATSAKLRDAINDREKVLDKLKAAKDKLKGLREDRTDFIAGVQKSVVGSVDLTDNTSTVDMAAELQAKLNAVKTFRGKLAELQKMGLDDTTRDQLLKEFLANGNTDAADALLSGGTQAIKQVATLQGMLSAEGKKLGTLVGDDMYNAGIRSAEGLVKGLDSQADKLKAVAEKLGKNLVAAVKKQLGIKSPSKVFADEIGAMLPSGLGEGIRANQLKALRPLTALNSRMVGEAKKLNVAVSHETSLVPSRVPASWTATQNVNVGASIGQAVRAAVQDLVLNPQVTATVRTADMDTMASKVQSALINVRSADTKSAALAVQQRVR